MLIAATVLVSSALVPPVAAQVVKQGGLTGKVVSVSVSVPAGGSVAVFTTPTTGFFILTEVCAATAGPNLDAFILSGNTFGRVVLRNDIVSAKADVCTAFAPGIALPAEETLTFTSPGASGTVMITGVVSRQ